MDQDALIRLYVKYIEYWMFLAPVILIAFLIKKAISLKEKKYFLASVILILVYLGILYCIFNIDPELAFASLLMIVSCIVIPVFFLWYGKKTRNHVLMILVVLYLLLGLAFMSYVMTTPPNVFE